ncbi:MAG: DUF177 domain-containing protein [Oleiphilaceae bacterium]|nr:DUF177 domain-containing protein [Oleiphilaceae bacterium]
MSNAKLPKSVDPFRLAEQNAGLEGYIPLSALGRFFDCILGPAASDAADQCVVSLSFGMDDERRRIVSGRLRAEVVLECQRCLKPMAAILTSNFRLGLVTSDEQALQLPNELEPFQTENFDADIWTMVEDELLLVLPSFPLHERSDCQATDVLESFERDPEAPEPEAEKRENPFDVLADLKKPRH